jgi:branched-subunit amino acid aminotransferase/4-amino-4-deoxychorismate lyase
LKSYVDGRWQPLSRVAAERVLARTALGGGVFTTLGVHGGAPLWLSHHLNRLAGEAVRLGCPVFPRGRLEELADRAIGKNRMRRGVVRIGLQGGVGEIVPFALCEPPRPTPQHPVLQLVHVDHGPLGGYAKSHHQLRWRSFRDQATALGVFDLLVVRRGRLTETGRFNLFLEVDGQLCTPPASEVFAGLARSLLLQAVGSEARVRPLAVADLVAARRIMLTNSVRGVLAVSLVRDAIGRVIWKGGTSAESLFRIFGEAATVALESDSRRPGVRAHE